MDTQNTTIRTVGPEDLQRGQYVIVTSYLEQWEPCSLFSTPDPDRTEPSVTRWRNPDPTPMLVVEVCLPYLLVREPSGEHRVLDLHRHRVARLADGFGRTASRRLKPRKDKEADGGKNSKRRKKRRKKRKK